MANQYLRLRQLCLVAHELLPVEQDLCAVFGVGVCPCPRLRSPNDGKS